MGTVLSTATGPVLADVHPIYGILNVPDFDQRRGASVEPYRYGLPPSAPSQCSGDSSIECETDADCGVDGPCIGFGGGMYCFPTSGIDWMAYLANNGYPQIDPGPTLNWQSMDVYNLIGEKIDEMGELMNTSASGGTGGENGRAGIEAWLTPYDPLFIVMRISTQNTYAPRLEDLAKAGLCGHLVIAGIGYYDKFILRDVPRERNSADTENSPRQPFLWVRDGGHLMAFNGASFYGDPLVRILSCRNPSSGGDSTLTQSTFSSSTTPLTGITGNFQIGDAGIFVRTHDRLDDWTNKPTFLDSYTAIVPFSLLTAVPVGDPPGVKWLNPVPVPPTNLPGATTLATSGAPIDGRFFPTFTEAVFVTQGATGSGNKLWHLDFVTGESAEIPLPEPPQRGEPTLIATGRSAPHSLYYNTSSPAGGVVVKEIMKDGSAGKTFSTFPPGANIAALIYHDETDALHVLSSATSQLLIFDVHSTAEPTVLALPAVVAPAGSVDMAVSRDGSEVWIADTAGETLYVLSHGPTGGLVVSETIACCEDFLPMLEARPSGPGASKPKEIVVVGTVTNSNSAGFRLLIRLDTDPPTGEGPLLELERAAAGGWQAAASPLVSGMTAARFIDVVRPRTNYDPATMTGPAWRDVLPAADFGENDNIPAASTWGLVAMSLVVLVAGSVIVMGHRDPSSLTAV